MGHSTALLKILESDVIRRSSLIILILILNWQIGIYGNYWLDPYINNNASPYWFVLTYLFNLIKKVNLWLFHVTMLTIRAGVLVTHGSQYCCRCIFYLVELVNNFVLLVTFFQFHVLLKYMLVTVVFSRVSCNLVSMSTTLNYNSEWVSEWVSECCLAPIQQLFSYIMARKN
jgi:hypothetical protein